MNTQMYLWNFIVLSIMEEILKLLLYTYLFLVTIKLMKMSEGCISFSDPSSKFLDVKTERLSQPIQNVMTTGYSLFQINKINNMVLGIAHWG